MCLTTRPYENEINKFDEVLLAKRDETITQVNILTRRITTLQRELLELEAHKMEHDTVLARLNLALNTPTT